MRIRDSTPKILFSKHQNKEEFKNLDDSEVLISDFPGLRTSAASMTSTAPTTSVASRTSIASFYQKLLILMIGSYLAPKRQISVHFCGMFIKNSIFY
jgi:hypothetical protein